MGISFKIVSQCILLSMLFVQSLYADDSSVASNNRGVSFILQMCSNKVTAQKKFWKQIYKNADVWNAGWLYGNTANPNGCTWSTKFMGMNKKKRVRVHICNSTCFPDRGRKCEQNECFAGMNTKDANKAILTKNAAVFKRIDNIIAQAKKDVEVAPNGTLLDYAVSPCLECTLSLEARKALFSYVKNQMKGITKEGMNPIKFVDNPYQNTTCLDEADLCEHHGTPSAKKKGVADNDGTDYDGINQINYWKNNVNAWMVLAWKPCLNGVTGKAGEGYVPATKRTDWCGLNREAPEFEVFTNSNFTTEPTTKVNDADLKGCSKKYVIGKDYTDRQFVWKLGDGRNYNVWVAPKEFPKFTTVKLMKDGKVIDKSYPQVGYRFGVPYAHDTGSVKRKVYDFRKHPSVYPDNSVLHADNTCFVFRKPAFRPFPK